MNSQQLPLVSIILPVFNAERTLERAIRSVIAQTYRNWELVISDNASTDSSWEIIQDFVNSDDRIRATRNASNLGPCANHNICIEGSHGSFIELFGSDDAFEPRCIEVLCDGFLERPNAVIATCAKKFVNENYETERISRPYEVTTCLSGADVIREFLKTLTNKYVSPVMFRAEFKGKGFDPKFFLYGDVDYWCSILLHGDLLYIDEELFSYSMCLNSVTTTCISDMGFGAELIALWNRYSYLLESDSSSQMEEVVSETCRVILEYSKEQRNQNFDWVFSTAAENRPISLVRNDARLDDEFILNLLKLNYFGFNYCNKLHRAKSKLDSEAESLRNELAEVRTKLENMERSTSWRLTSILRRVAQKIR